ncbi:hypothetical protein [Pseudomonas mosselii]|uniref:Uncharacterized protein n=1 Tax=Pseudomonas mosselii TaxID=78327 RepID=A0AA42RTA9_9PSED|nr:hypothetical protein [Pseudomonas mosselii]MDH1629557.1 hypothetical protein [Pseudomonas mosselii]
MNLRTFTVSNRDNEQLNAVVVCAFQATAINRTFLVYTLNEHLDSQLTRIYLAPVEIEPQAVLMSTASNEEFKAATQVLKALFEDLGKGQAQHASYQRIELGEHEVPPARLEGHHQIKVNLQWVLKLLSADPSAPGEAVGQPLIQTEEPESQHQQEQHPLPAKTLTYQLSATSSDPSMALHYSLGDRQKAPAAQSLPAPSSVNTSQDQSRFENLRKLERNIRVVVASLNQKKKDLEARGAQLKKLEQQLAEREAVLLRRESELEGKDNELNEGLSELAKIDHDLDELFRDLSIEDGTAAGL